MNLINQILDQKTPYERSASKSDLFMTSIRERLNFHNENCKEFKNFILNNKKKLSFEELKDAPFLPVRLFKLLDLKSISSNEIFKIMTSSGTSGQSVSKIFLDKESAKIQTKVLNHIISSILGKKRRKMLVIDSHDIVTDKGNFSARKAGILGFSSFGKDHTYLLDKNLELKLDLLTSLIRENEGEPIFIFGFTFLVWEKLINTMIKHDLNIRFPADTILIHGGGWKKLIDQKVRNEEFRLMLNQFGINKVFDYYGMIEQTGSIFMECDQGFLHCSDYSDIIVRNPLTMEVQDNGKKGILQLFSLLPSSYPGNSLLTEDIGIIYSMDDCLCGKKGKYFKVLGRMEDSEVRGCSDTRAI